MAMTVEEISRSTNVSPDTVRYYTRIGLLEPARHPANGYRLYDASDVRKLRFILKAKWLGFSLAEIRRLISCSEMGESSCLLARGIVERRIVENQRRIDALQTLQENMESALAKWKASPTHEPSGRSICHFIESFDGGTAAELDRYAAQGLPGHGVAFAADESLFQSGD